MYPENTMSAFEAGIKAGAHGFECDLRLSSDGEIVIFHDDDLRRLCGQSGSIETLTWKEIQKLRVFGKEKIPHLDEVLENFHPEVINLEIKHSTRDAVVAEAVLRKLTKLRPTARILLSSFSIEVLRALNTMDPHRKLGALGLLVETSGISDLPKISREISADTWNAPRQILGSPWKNRWAHEKIMPLWVWTCDEPDQWKALVESPLPIEAIITNKSDALSQFLSSFTQA